MSSDTVEKKRKALIKTTKERLREWDTYITRIEERASAEPRETKEDLERSALHLKHKKDQLEDQLKKLEDSADETWIEDRPDLERLIADVSESFEHAWQRIARI